MLAVYLLLLAFGLQLSLFVFLLIGKDLKVLPKSNIGQLQLRIREPDGTRLEVTEDATKNILDIIDSAVNGNIAISSVHVWVDN